MDKKVQKSLVIKEDALAELEEQVVYFCLNYSATYAEQFRLDFFKTVFSILPNPNIYPECRFLPTITQMYRNIVWGNYLIIYKIKPKTVEILSLFHCKQKPTKIKMLRRRI